MLIIIYNSHKIEYFLFIIYYNNYICIGNQSYNMCDNYDMNKHQGERKYDNHRKHKDTRLANNSKIIDGSSFFENDDLSNKKINKPSSKPDDITKCPSSADKKYRGKTGINKNDKQLSDYIIGSSVNTVKIDGYVHNKLSCRNHYRKIHTRSCANSECNDYNQTNKVDFTVN